MGVEKEDPKLNLLGKKRNYQVVNDIDRLKLILLITENKHTCFSAAKKLQIPYTNAKVIHRIF